MVVGSVWWQLVGFSLAEQIHEFVVFWRNCGQVEFWSLSNDFGFLVGQLRPLEFLDRQEEQLGPWLVAYVRKGCRSDQGHLGCFAILLNKQGCVWTDFPIEPLMAPWHRTPMQDYTLMWSSLGFVFV